MGVNFCACGFFGGGVVSSTYSGWISGGGGGSGSGMSSGGGVGSSVACKRCLHDGCRYVGRHFSRDFAFLSKRNRSEVNR